MFVLSNNKKQTVMKDKIYVCYDAGCGIYAIDEFNEAIEWHKNEYKGTYKQCMQEKKEQEIAAYRYNNFLPHLSNC